MLFAVKARMKMKKYLKRKNQLILAFIKNI